MWIYLFIYLFGKLTLTYDQHEVIKTVLKYEQCKNDVKLMVDKIYVVSNGSELSELDVSDALWTILALIKHITATLFINSDGKKPD